MKELRKQTAQELCASLQAERRRVWGPGYTGKVTHSGSWFTLRAKGHDTRGTKHRRGEVESMVRQMANRPDYAAPVPPTPEEQEADWEKRRIAQVQELKDGGWTLEMFQDALNVVYSVPRYHPGPQAGRKKCCERDTDSDGNCDKHLDPRRLAKERNKQ